MKTFKSKHNTTYSIIYRNEKIKLSFAVIDNQCIRVRISSWDLLELNKVRSYLPQNWKELKDGDHYSITVKKEYLTNAVTDAFKSHHENNFITAKF